MAVAGNVQREFRHPHFDGFFDLMLAVDVHIHRALQGDFWEHLAQKRDDTRVGQGNRCDAAGIFEGLDIAADTFEVVKKVDPFVQEHISFDLVAAAELDQLPDFIVGGFSGIETGR